MLIEGLLAEGENGGQVATDGKRMGEPSEGTKGKFIIDRVADERGLRRSRIEQPVTHGV